MCSAFKEWAVVVDALERGEQILILRKGGLAEGRGGFQLEQRQFLLFPTLFHQQRESVLSAAQTRFDILFPTLSPDRVRLGCFGVVTDGWKLGSFSAVQRLRGLHCWREEVIEQRFEWGREQAIFALALRVFRLPEPVELPVLPAYGGCKSWIELEPEIPVEGAVPVLDDSAFEQARSELIRRLGVPTVQAPV